MVINEKECVKFNLSPTSLNLYYDSPLLFYLTYIAKAPDDTPVPRCYGLSGNIVHDCLEKYSNGDFDKDGACLHLLQKWDKIGMDFHKDLSGNSLNKTQYLMALLSGINVVDSHESHISEEMISFPFIESDFMSIGIKGIIDLQAEEKESGEKVVIDYKTSNSVAQGKEFERQALFYNYLLSRKKKVIPDKTIFHYLKLGIPKVYQFTEGDVLAFEEELKIVAEEILEKGTDISNYPVGNIDSIFNSKKQACLKEIERRNGFVNNTSELMLGYDSG